MSESGNICSNEEKANGLLVHRSYIDPCYGPRYKTMHENGRLSFHFRPIEDPRKKEFIDEERREVLKIMVHLCLEGVPFWMVQCPGISPSEISRGRNEVNMLDVYVPKYDLPFHKLKERFLKDIGSMDPQKSSIVRDRYCGYGIDYHYDIEYVICALDSLTKGTRFYDDYHRLYEHSRISRVEKGKRRQIVFEFEKGQFQTLVTTSISDWSGVLVWLIFFSWYTVNDSVADWQFKRGGMKKVGAIRKRRTQLFNPYTADKIFETYFSARTSFSERMEYAIEFDRDTQDHGSDGEDLDPLDKVR